MNTDNTVMMFISLAVAINIYFIPLWIANHRKHHNFTAIVLVNLFLGWTFLGWLAALVWSTTAVNPKTPEKNTPSPTPAAPATATKECPDCAETIKRAAKVCRYCSHKFS